MNDSAETMLDVAIIGAGISGLGMAARLVRDLPGHRFAVFERRARLGGTWDLFRYPGIRSDSDMYTLGFSFAPWRSDNAIGSGSAIRDYLARVAQQSGVSPHIRYDTQVTAADWDTAGQCWRLTQADGARASARFLYLGAGYYDADKPHAPDIPGIERFAGPVVHPQFWPDGLELAGKRIVVIGSGATAVSLVPALARAGAHVTMLQRTPTWYLILPSHDRVARLLQRILPAGLAHRLIRARNTRLQDMLYRKSRSDPGGTAAWLAAQTRRALGDAWNATDFTPPYGPWEQRLCLVPDGDLLRLFRKRGAGIATGRIAEVEADGVVLADGRRLQADVLVTATGLALAPGGGIAVSVEGRPVNFADHFWYRDCMFSNLPNLAVLFGYLNAGWTLRVEVVADYLCRLLRQMAAWKVRVATPVLPADHALEEEDLFTAYSSGYLKRGQHLLPRNATVPPWRLEMDYFTDRAQLAAAPIDDGWLRFERAGAASPLVESAPTT